MSDNDRERIAHDRRDALAFGSQAIRWVFASLLLLHGAGLVALLNKADVLPVGALQAAHEFAAGLIATLGAGMLSAVSAFGAAARFDGDLRDNQPYAARGFLMQMGFAGIALTFLGISLITFALGVLEVGGALGVDQPNKSAKTQPSSHKPGIVVDRKQGESR